MSFEAPVVTFSGPKMSSSATRPPNIKAIFDVAARFARSGGKLVKLEFPKTEIQVYGYTAVVYSDYLYELESGGQRHQQSGRVTEIFVLRKGQWVNPGWHMDSGK